MNGRYECMASRLLDKLGTQIFFFRKVIYGMLGESRLCLARSGTSDSEMGLEMMLAKGINMS